MPLYDYQCRSCKTVTEVRHGAREDFGGTCPQCGGELARVFNPAGIAFKGSGFYVTDSRKSSGASEGGSSSPPSTPSPPSDGGAPAKKSETAA
ncbi:MAG TPA: FmdB family zinc ribbon protein [Candidatus Elarobacter sp.]|jgi:putative FmdB family regulatory protein